jgi:CubicO group peptidase (beta-lactamase class C family)
VTPSRVEEAQGGGAVAVAAFLRGRPVADLRAGTARWDTVFHTWSAIKPVAGTCLLLLIERGRLRLDDRVARTWPELGAARPDLQVRHLLGHAAGRIAVPVPGTAASLLEWDHVIAGLAGAPPDRAPPGSAVGEHAFTFGHLVGEMVRRIDGRPLRRFLAEEICGPIGLDIHVGVPEPALGRVSWRAPTADRRLRSGCAARHPSRTALSGKPSVAVRPSRRSGR